MVEFFVIMRTTYRSVLVYEIREATDDGAKVDKAAITDDGYGIAKCRGSWKAVEALKKDNRFTTYVIA